MNAENASTAAPATNRFEGRALEPLAPGEKVLVVTNPALVRAILLSEFAGRTPEELKYVQDAMLGTLRAASANPRLGVFEGTVTEIDGTPTPLGLHRVNADIATDAVAALETEDALTAALGGEAPRPRLFGETGLIRSHGMGARDRDLAEAYPWLERAGLSADELAETYARLADFNIRMQIPESQEDREAIAKRAPELDERITEAQAKGDEDLVVRLVIQMVREDLFLRMPAERFQLVLPDNPWTRRIVRWAFDAVIASIKKERGEGERDRGLL